MTCSRIVVRLDGPEARRHRGCAAGQGRAAHRSVHLAGAHAILPKGARLPRRHGRVTVRFGPPLVVPPGTPIAEATAAVEAAVRTLARRVG
jgi:hypothetical protein